METVVSITELGRSLPGIHASAIYDARRDRVVVFGGLRASGIYTSEIASIELSPLAFRLPSWEGTPLPGYTSAGTARDEEGDRTFIVAGYGYDFDNHSGFISRAVAIRPVGSDSFAADRLPDCPLGPRGPAAGYDPDGQRLVVVGGWDGRSGQWCDETYVIRPYDPSPEWRVLTGAAGAQEQEGAYMAHVPGLGLVLLAKDSDQGDPPSTMGLFVMRTGSERWERLDTEQELPDAWARERLLWDPGACRLIAWGGGCHGAMWSFDVFASPVRVTQVELLVDPEPRYAVNLVLDPLRRRIIVHGGYDCDIVHFYETVYALEF